MLGSIQRTPKADSEGELRVLGSIQRTPKADSEGEFNSSSNRDLFMVTFIAASIRESCYLYVSTCESIIQSWLLSLLLVFARLARSMAPPAIVMVTFIAASASICEVRVWIALAFSLCLLHLR